ncbi:hypothetical protein DMX02_23650 [Pseudomonas jessenii]|nr:hypothetical protein DMX02_23650 [Pseudomonas jessenii]
MLNRWTLPGQQALCWLAVIFAVGFPRIMVLGDLPSTDEGVFAYFSQIMFSSVASGSGLPDTGTLMLYPMLVSWIFDLPFNHFFLLRITDLIAAITAGVLFYRIIEKESQSHLAAALISIIFLFTMNQPLFIQSGFKNSIYAAYIPLFIALLWSRTAEQGARTWLWIGALGAVSILLRETFIPFVVLGAASVLVSRGWKTFFRFSFGVVLGGVVLTAAALILRGGFQSFVDGYVNAGDFYTSMKDQITSLLIANGMLAAKQSVIALWLAGLAVAGLLGHIIYNRRFDVLKRLLFWISVATVPLLEPLSKIGFPYHFSVCLPGLAGLCALSWEQLVSPHSKAVKAAAVAALIAVCATLLQSKVPPLLNAFAANKENLRGFNSNTWRPEAIAQSNYLLAADAIAKVAPAHGTLGISGFMFSLFPLTGLLPSSYESSHLSAMVIKYGLDESAFKNALAACPPDIVMTTTRTDFPGSDIIANAIEHSGLYTAVTTIPVSPEKSYGTFAGTVYKRTGQSNVPRSSSCL